MSEWREVALGEVLDIKHGYAFRGEHFGLGGCNRLVTPGNFYEGGGFRDRGALQKSYDGPLPGEYVLSPGALIVAMTEQSPGLLGSSGLVPHDGFQWLHNQRIGLVKPLHAEADERFIYSLFNDPSVRGQISATASGTKVRHTSPGRLKSVRVRMPSIGTQRHIAAVLSAFDELIEINERRIEVLEELARSLYREWFVRFRFPGHAAVDFTDSDVGPLPEGWRVAAFAAIGEFLNGYAFKPSHWGDEGIPIIKIKELKQGVTTATPRYGGVDLESRYFVEPGDLLFSWSADLGVYLWAGERGALNQHLFKVSPTAGIGRAYLYYSLEAALPRFRSRAQGTTMKHIKRSALMEVDCVLPDQVLQAAFSETVGPMHEEVLTLKNEVAMLAATRDLLLPRLVTGRLDISEIDLGALLPAEAA